MNVWTCSHCGHEHEGTETLEELSFIRFDEDTTKTTCAGCGTFTIQRVYTYDKQGLPIAGYFLTVKTKIRKGHHHVRENRSL